MIENRGTQLVKEYQDSGLGQREFAEKPASREVR